jgi:putative photosynthetic complex assembly protein
VSHSTTSSRFISRLPLLAVGGVIAIALGLAIAGPRVVGGPTPAPTARLLAERTLSFSDRADHAVVATENGKTVAVFEGEQGFVRGILRGLNRSRRGMDIPRDAPLRLAAYADGRMTLEDPATGIRLDLAAFGPTNEGVFAALLPPPAVKLAEHRP